MGLVYVLDIPPAAAWRQECGGRVEAGVPLGMGKKLSLYMPFLAAGNALLALAETTVGRLGPLSRANGYSTMSLHTYDLGGHTVGVRLGKIPATWSEGGKRLHPGLQVPITGDSCPS